jgi:diaminohydroxyphosphoribosylaminopyrimidine deaminase / 5-amino-6-(5-phosphoribosylamino)uracil reductase
MSYNETFMLEAYKLAEESRGNTGNNPFVGALIVKNGKITGRGRTQQCGKNHAEVEALIAAGANSKDGEMYVTLEPCCHQGKTPPCTEAIIEAGIKKVYAGIIDPNPLVNGKGLLMLKEAGIKVEYNYLQQEINRQLEYYLTNVRENRPFFIMKSAVSLDGKVALDSGESKWITSEQSRENVHRLRNEADAILTGIDTVLYDDPLLSVRLPDKCTSPLRIVLDSKLRIPLNSQIVVSAREIPTVIFKDSQYRAPEKENKLIADGISIKNLPLDESGKLSLQSLVSELHLMGLQTVMVEAGPKLNSNLLRAGLIDKIYYFIAPKILGGTRSVLNELNIESMDKVVKLEFDKIERVGEDLLIIAYPVKT